MLKGSNNGSIESMREGNKKKARRVLAIGEAGPSDLASLSKLGASDSARTDIPPTHNLDLEYNNEDDHALPEPEERLECNGDAGITSPVLSDASMASNPVPTQSEPVASARLPSEFKTEYHPCSGHPTLFQPFDKFGISPEAQQVPIIDKELWRPFRSRGDFEFSEIAIEAALNKSQINALLSLITHISEGCAEITLKNEVDLSKAWDNAAAELTLHTGTEFEHFFDEPWTGDRWWDIQSSLPDIDGTILFCFILYADKTKLSSHGTVKGYPVVGFGGGRVVGWLPIVPEDAGEEGKLGYMNLKHVVWHELFFKLLELAAQYSKTGYSHKCHNNILRWLFPLILILSADYEEQCMMSLIHGHGGKCPCPVFLVPLAELHDLSKTYPLRSVDEAKEALHIYGLSKAQGEELLKALGLQPVENIFWIILYSDPHDALSLDRLHSLHTGLWKHLLGELKKILASLGCEAEAAFEKLIANFPQWRNLNHFKSIINISFTNGNKYQDLSEQSLYAGLSILTPRASPGGYQLLCVISSYLQLDSWIGLDVHTESTLAAYVTCAESSDIKKLKLDWNFPKTHLWKHVMHGPLKDTYHHQTNRKDIATQILRVDHHQFASKLLREHVNIVDEHNRLWALGDDLPDEDVAVAFNGHVKLGSPTPHPSSILDLENWGPADRAFQAFRRKFTEFTNHSLPTYGHQLTSWLTFPADFQIHKHRYLKYVLEVSWKCLESFLFSYLLLLIVVYQNFDLSIIKLCATDSGLKTDRFFKLTCVKAVPRASSIFVPLNSFIQDAVLVPDPDHQDEFLVADHIDSDMFLQMKTWVPQLLSLLVLHILHSAQINTRKKCDSTHINTCKTLGPVLCILVAHSSMHARNLDHALHHDPLINTCKKLGPLYKSALHRDPLINACKKLGPVWLLLSTAHFDQCVHKTWIYSTKECLPLVSIKDCAGIIFSSFKLDPNLFADQPSKKQGNKDLLVLLKRNGEGDYIHLVLILFAKPDAMAADDFLKSPVLIKIVHVKVFGKAILGGKTRGHPKGRGLHMGTQSVSEGMIAGAAILAHFLLTHDAELTAIGSETKIDYQKDYDFYLEHLLKGTPWAISVMEYFNKEVFNTTTVPSAPTSTVLSAAAPRTWEDDFLQELDNLDPVTHDPSSTRSIAHAPSPSLSTHTAPPMPVTATSAVICDDHSVSTAMNFTSLTQMSISQACVTSTSTQLHVDINQLSLADNGVGNSLVAAPVPLTMGPKVPARWGHISAQAAQVPAEAPEVPPEAPKAKRALGVFVEVPSPSNDLVFAYCLIRTLECAYRELGSLSYIGLLAKG
ncbi:hypothetical protein EDB19DRAFT_1826190 [Suillus lakei]|nr:hypothetical protein EDB19DRAFT_1826190 [Suillus lakei]